MDPRTTEKLQQLDDSLQLSQADYKPGKQLHELCHDHVLLDPYNVFSFELVLDADEGGVDHVHGEGEHQ